MSGFGGRHGENVMAGVKVDFITLTYKVRE
jgi:hypothetical protein